MEVSGLVLSAAAMAALLTQVVKIGDKYVREIRNWDKEAEKLAIRMAGQMERTDQIRKIFFGDSRDTPSPSNSPPVGPEGVMPLINHLDYQTKSNICAMMQQFHNIINLRYRSLQAAYDLGTTEQVQSTSKFRFSWVFVGKAAS